MLGAPCDSVSGAARWRRHAHPGPRVNVSAGFGIFDYFTVRGLDSLTGGLVLTDGVSEPESTFYPLYNVRQIEVLKGSGELPLRARFAVNLKNLTGTEYATRGFGGVSAIPARPFEVLGRIDLRLGSR